MTTSPAIPVPAPSTVIPAGGPLRRWAAPAGLVYVAAWLVGLLVAPAAPSDTAAAADVHAFYVEHGPSVMAQSLLVHGLAGVALIVLAVAGGRAFASRRATVAGVGAALVSFVQVAFAAAATSDPAGSSAAASRNLLQAVNTADVVKLVLLGAFVALLTAAVARVRGRRAHRALGFVLAAMLPVGGASFLVANGVLSAVLAASLVLLLAWAAWTGVLTSRSRA